MKAEEILARFADVTEEGDGWLATCPSHSDSKPSLRITMGRKDGTVLVKCRAGCATRDVVAAVGLTMGDLFEVSAPPSAPRSTDDPSVPLSPTTIAALAVRLDAYAAALAEHPEALDYAERRFGVDRASAERLGLGYADDLVSGPRLVIPFRDERGIARGFQARALDPAVSIRWTGPSRPGDGSTWTAVGYFEGAAEWSEVVVTEGPGDALTACAVGFDAIGVRGASLAQNPHVAEEIVRIANGRPVVVFGDADAAGEKFARELVAALARAGAAIAAPASPQTGGDLSAWRELEPETFEREFVARVHAALASAPDAIAARLDALEERDLTDLGLAKRLRARVEARGSGVRYSPEVGFYLLDRGVWRRDELDSVRTAAQESADDLWRLAKEIEREIEALGDDPRAAVETRRLGRLRSAAKHANSTRGIDSMIRELQALPGVAADVNAFDRHAHLVACRNGVVNLRTGRLQEHDPDLLLTRRIDLDFDPSATAPRWERFLGEVFETHPDLPAFVQRLVGYGITGETSEQAFAVLWGTGSNGKSVFTDTLTEVFRELTVTTPFSTFEERPSGGIPNDLAALKGARLVMASEGEQGRPMAEAVLKRVTGRDLIAARFMRKEFFEFRPTFLLLLATNFRPQFRGQDEGLWRRVKLIPWERYFAPHERDPYLGAALLDEAPGIFAWAVRGAVDWYSGGLRDPEVVRHATKEYRETSDALAGFLPGVYVFDHESDELIPGKRLFSDFLEWASEENLPAREVWTRKTFFSALEERGLVKRRVAQGMAFCGVRRAVPADHVADDPAPARVAEVAPADFSSAPIPSARPSLADLKE